ncbi:MAG: hypothetical protein WCV81_00635 [Microgenomates group bacterium]|jgi:hypothetical protein
MNQKGNILSKNNKYNESKGFAPIIIILGIVLMLGIAGGAYFLVKNSNTVPKNNIIAPTISPTPTATLKVDETANWNTYTNTKYSYSIKYPTDYSLIEVTPDYIRIFQAPTKPTFPKTESYLSVQLNTISFEDPKLIYKTTTDGKTLVITPVIMSTEDSDKQKVQSIFDQITATFKFLDSNTGTAKYTCPENGYQNCMPILDTEGQKQCSSEALDWKKANCPNFSGAAY